MSTNDPNQLELADVIVAPEPENCGVCSMDQSYNAGPPKFEPNFGSPARPHSRLTAKKKSLTPKTRVDLGLLEPLLAYNQAALALGVSLRTLRRLVDDGKIAFVMVSDRAPRIRPSDLRRYIDESANKYTQEDSEEKL